MRISDALLPECDHEMASTRKMLERVRTKLKMHNREPCCSGSRGNTTPRATEASRAAARAGSVAVAVSTAKASADD